MDVASTAMSTRPERITTNRLSVPTAMPVMVPSVDTRLSSSPKMISRIEDTIWVRSVLSIASSLYPLLYSQRIVHMKLPDPIRPFDQATLIVVTDNVQAKLFRADGRNVELVSVMSQKLEPMEQERMAIATGAGMRSGDEHNPGDLKAWTREHLYSELSKELMRRLQNGEFERLAFCAPEEHVEELKECLHVELLKQIGRAHV